MRIQSLIGKEIVTEEVTTFDESFRRVVQQLLRTLHKTEGVGLSAPQVGRTERVAVIDFRDGREPLILVNPTLLKYYGTSTEMEGCLSYRDIYGEVKRPNAIRIEAEDEDGQPFEITAEGIEARVILHEMDHLYGVDFLKSITKRVDVEQFEREEDEA